MNNGATGGLDVADWARRLRVVILALNGVPRLDDVVALRQLLAQQPTHYLGGQWMDMLAEARQWLDRAEGRLPGFVRLPPDDPPLVPAAPLPFHYSGDD